MTTMIPAGALQQQQHPHLSRMPSQPFIRQHSQTFTPARPFKGGSPISQQVVQQIQPHPQLLQQTTAQPSQYSTIQQPFTPDRMNVMQIRSPSPPPTALVSHQILPAKSNHNNNNNSNTNNLEFRPRIHSRAVSVQALRPTSPHSVQPFSNIPQTQQHVILPSQSQQQQILLLKERYVSNNNNNNTQNTPQVKRIVQGHRQSMQVLPSHQPVQQLSNQPFQALQRQQQQQQQIATSPFVQMNALTKEELQIQSELKSIKQTLEGMTQEYLNTLSGQRMSAEQMATLNNEFQEKIRRILATYEQLPNKYPSTLCANEKNLPRHMASPTHWMNAGFANVESLMFKHLQQRETTSTTPKQQPSLLTQNFIPVTQQGTYVQPQPPLIPQQYLSTQQNESIRNQRREEAQEYSPIVRMHQNQNPMHNNAGAAEDIFASNARLDPFVEDSQVMPFQFSDNKALIIQQMRASEQKAVNEFNVAKALIGNQHVPEVAVGQQSRMVPQVLFETDEKVKRSVKTEPVLQTNEYPSMQFSFKGQPQQQQSQWNTPNPNSNIDTLNRRSSLAQRSAEVQFSGLKTALKSAQKFSKINANHRAASTSSSNLDQIFREEKYAMNNQKNNNNNNIHLQNVNSGNPTGVVNTYDYATLTEIDLRMSKVKSTIEQTLDSILELDQTKTLLLEIVENLRKAINQLSEPARQLSVIANITKNTERIVGDSTASYPLYLYFQKVLANVDSAIQSGNAQKFVAIDDEVGDSFWQEAQIDNNDPRQLHPILARAASASPRSRSNNSYTNTNPFQKTLQQPSSSQQSNMQFFIREHLKVPEYVPLKTQLQKQQKVNEEIQESVKRASKGRINTNPTQNSISSPMNHRNFNNSTATTTTMNGNRGISGTANIPPNRSGYSSFFGSVNTLPNMPASEYGLSNKKHHHSTSAMPAAASTQFSSIQPTSNHQYSMSLQQQKQQSFQQQQQPQPSQFLTMSPPPHQARSVAVDRTYSQLEEQPAEDEAVKRAARKNSSHLNRQSQTSDVLIVNAPLSRSSSVSSILKSTTPVKTSGVGVSSQGVSQQQNLLTLHGEGVSVFDSLFQTKKAVGAAGDSPKRVNFMNTSNQGYNYNTSNPSSTNNNNNNNVNQNLLGRPSVGNGVEKSNYNSGAAYASSRASESFTTIETLLKKYTTNQPNGNSSISTPAGFNSKQVVVVAGGNNNEESDEKVKRSAVAALSQQSSQGAVIKPVAIPTSVTQQQESASLADRFSLRNNGSLSVSFRSNSNHGNGTGQGSAVASSAVPIAAPVVKKQATTIIRSDRNMGIGSIAGASSLLMELKRSSISKMIEVPTTTSTAGTTSSNKMNYSFGASAANGSKNEDDKEKRMRFFDLAVQIKDSFPAQHKCRMILVSSLWDQLKNYQEQDWRNIVTAKCQEAGK